MDEKYNGGNPLALPEGYILHNKFKIGKVLGAGGFGITYEAQNTQEQRKCAIKEYVPQGMCVRDGENNILKPSSNEKYVDYEHGKVRFIEEANILQELQYIPTIVTVWETFEENNTAYYSMEYLEGKTINKLQKMFPNKKLALDDAIEIVQTIGATLDKIHKEKQLLHRDISPDNIFYTKQGKIKLIDFGSAKHLSNSQKNVFSVVLKPGYAPPEQYSSTMPQGSYTDEYALASTFYCMVTGKMPTDASERLAEKKLIPAYELEPSVSMQMWQIMDKALNLDYRRRYSSVGQFVEELSTSYRRNTLKEKPQDLSKQLQQLSKQSGSSKKQVIDRPYLFEAAGNELGIRWYIPEDIQIRVGRSRECNIQLSQYMQISKVHCSLQYDSLNRCFLLCDLSTNGVIVNQTKLQKGKIYRVESGDVMILADIIGIQFGVEKIYE